MNRGDAIALAAFDTFFTRPDVVKVPLSTAAFDRATILRSAFGFKTPNAIHLAAALEGGCGLFLTNDGRLSRCPDIPIEVLP
jgi:predicted nucleic acid-binding protein